MISRRGLVQALCAILTLLAPAARAANARKLLAGTVTGTAIVLNEDREGHPPRRMLAVRTPDGRRVHVEVADERQLAGLHTGMHVELTGSWAQQAPHRRLAAAPGSKFVAASIAASAAAFAAPTLTIASASRGVSFASGPASLRPAMTLSTNQMVTSNLNALFIPIAGMAAPGVACPGTQRPKFTADQVRQAVFAEANPGGITVGSTFDKCSFGKTRLTRNNSMVADLVELPCQGTTNGEKWAFNTCEGVDFNGYADAADVVLQARGIDLSRYKYRVYLIPPGPCKFVGLGSVGCHPDYDCRAWMGSDWWAAPNGIAHEIGHSLFMGHAGAVLPGGGVDAYADLTGAMGYCCSDRCPNTPHAWQLGWVSVQQLDGTSLKPGQTVDTIVASQSLSARSGLRIVPSWAAGVDPLFVGYRTQVGGDVGIKGAGKVHIYTSAITNSRDIRPTTWQAALETRGQVWQHPTAGLVVRLINSSPSSVRLTVCRRRGAETLASCQAGMDNDCNGRAGANDGACNLIFKKAAVIPPTLVRRTNVRAF